MTQKLSLGKKKRETKQEYFEGTRGKSRGEASHSSTEKTRFDSSNKVR